MTAETACRCHLARQNVYERLCNHCSFNSALATIIHPINQFASSLQNILESFKETSIAENIRMSRLLPPRFLLPSRHFFTSTTRRTAFATGPAPPRLPPKEQEEFERLQKTSTGAFSTPKPVVNQAASEPVPARVRPQINQSPASEPAKDDAETIINPRVAATGKGEELHPDIRRGAKPEFEGDVNPKTGEVGGPKNEPLRWGSTGDRGDWSYNGRVTDF